MTELLLAAIPEIHWIKDPVLRQATVNAYLDALQSGGWSVEDLDRIPFTLLVETGSVSYLKHVRAVTQMCHTVWEEYQTVYQENDVPSLHYEYLISGALLHDVGKLLEYEKSADGTIVKSKLGKELRHPFTGVAVALRNGIPTEIAHMIANHAKEGDGTLRSPEAVIVHRIDIMNFEIIKSFRGII